MKKVSCLVSGIFLIAGVVHAKADKPVELDKISMVLSSKRWVTASNAKIEVSINATLNQTSVVEIRRDILKNLDIIAKGQWHIVQFNRSQGSSGLEDLYVKATSRVAPELLTDTYAQAKKVSKPGVQYNITNIDFAPSFADVKKAEAAVRQDLYQKIKQEVKQLNEIYTKQHYSVHKIVFTSSGQADRMLEKSQQAPRANMMFTAMSSNEVSMAVSNQVKLDAFVTIASDRDNDN